jgi:single-stranded-DNA-specific exonuclease
MTMLAENITAFQDRFETVVASSITEELLVPEIIIDAEVELKDLTPSFYKILTQMEPFGPGNAKPVFIVRQVYNTGHSKIVKENHIKFSLTRDNYNFSGIGFNLAGKYHLLEQRQPVDIVFTLDENDWNSQKNLQLRVIDLRL